MYSNEGYQALRGRSAVVRRGDRGILNVSGADRLVWLQGLLTNDVAALRPGDSCYALYLTPQGRMISDMRVVNHADRTLLEVPAVLAESLRAKLDSLLFAEDAQVSDVSTSIAAVDLLGPEAPSILDRAPAAMAPRAIHGVIRDSSYGVPGATLLVAWSEVDTLVRELVALGAVETTLETLDVLRIEAGRPLFLVDMDEHTIPLEAGLERAISFTKGCYVGQEVIVRVLQRGHGRVAKKLVGVLLPRDSTPRAGDLVRTDERDIGRLTSVVRSPALERPIALGYVHREFIEPGTPVVVATREGPTTATIAPLPFIAAQQQSAQP